MAAPTNIWKSLVGRRERKKEEKRAAERAFEIEEENVGRLIEHQNKIDKGEWEAIYGKREEGDHPKPADSGVIDIESLKKAASTNASVPNSRDGSFAYAELEAVPARRQALSSEEEKRNFSIDAMRKDPTVMMAHDLPAPQRPPPEAPKPKIIPNISVRDFGTLAVSPKPPVALSEHSILERASSQVGSEVGSRAGSQFGSRNNSHRVSRVGSQLSSQSQSRSQSRQSSRPTSENSHTITNEPPEVIPLPFKIPTTPTDEDFPDDSSSIATFNDHPEDLKRKSRLLSLGSADLLNQYSAPPQHSEPPPQRRLVPGPRPRPAQRSSPGLMVPQDDEDKRFSTMANFDDDSDIDVNEIMVPDAIMEEDMEASSLQGSPTRQSFAEGSVHEVSPRGSSTTQSLVEGSVHEVSPQGSPTMQSLVEGSVHETSAQGSPTRQSCSEKGIEVASPQGSPTRQSFAERSSEPEQIEDDYGEFPIGTAVTTGDVDVVAEKLEDDDLTPTSEPPTLNNTEMLDQPASPTSVEGKLVVEPQENDRPKSTHFLPLVSPPRTEAAESPNALSTAGKDIESEERPSLSKDILPATVSKVVMSYRTNEWAKHLDTADIPIVEDPSIAPSPTTSEPDDIRELPAPVNVEALQQTPENAAIPPAQIIPTARTSQMPRSYSQPNLPRSNSNNSQISAASYRSSRLTSKPGFELRGAVTRSSTQSSLPNTLNRSSSQTSLHSNYTTSSSRPRDSYKRSNSNPIIGPALIEDPQEDVPPIPGRFLPPQLPYGSTTTLMSQRDTMIRGKTSFQGAINNHAISTRHEEDDDTISMSARRDKLRQSSLNKLTSAVPTNNRNPPNPARVSTAPPPQQKDQMLRVWRASVQQELQAGHGSYSSYERQRNELWQKKQREATQRQMEGERVKRSEYARAEYLRKGNLEEAHRMAMRKMQAAANKQL